MLALSLLLWACSGCLVVTLGDSNTCNTGGCVGSRFYWPSRHPLPRPWALENRGEGGVTAGAYFRCAGTLQSCPTERDCDPGVSCAPLTLQQDGGPTSGRWRLDQALAAHAHDDACLYQRLGFAPKLVIALGTNDLILGASAFAVGQAVLGLYDHARSAAPCVEAYVATIPPLATVDPDTVWIANMTIVVGMAGRSAAAHVIPFHRQRPLWNSLAGVHFSDIGQEERWALAYPVLFP